MSWQQRLDELKITLPPAPAPGGAYAPIIITGCFAYTAGHVPIRPDGSFVTGKVGVDLTVEEGYEAAKLTALFLLSSLKEKLGSLDRVKRVVKVLGLVNCPPDFKQHPQVINGFSDFLIEIFGEECGKAARSAFGAGSLPLGCAVEIEAIFEIETD